jgi:glutathione S-transferase
MHSAPKRLFDFPFSGNGYKVRLALAQLALPVDYEVVDILSGDGQSPNFLALTPMGQVPALQLEDGTVLWESNAILYWLTEGTPLMPADRLGRTRVVQWMTFEQSNIDKVLGRTRFLKRYPDFMETRPNDWAGWYTAGNRALKVMDGHLATRDFMVGDSYSAADICLYGYVHSANEGGFALAGYPAISRWLERIRAQPRHIPITAHS